jgi:cell division protein ZipA
MPVLQQALIGCGLLFLLGLGLWEWRRSRHLSGRSQRAEPKAPDITLMGERPRRVEPGLGEMSGMRTTSADEALEVPTIMPLEPLPVARGNAVDVPAAARGADGDALLAPASAAAPAPPVAIRWPPLRADRVLTLRVVKADGEALPGRALRIALEATGLVSGPQTIYHRADPQGAVIVSAANLVHPGTLDPAHMDAGEYRGLSLFSVLPGPLPAARMLAELVATARSIAHRLGAVVQDENGADLDGVQLTALRRTLSEGGGAVGDGRVP